MAEEIVYGINFDVKAFVSNVQEALDAIKKFEGQGDQMEAAIKLLAQRVNSVSFSKPVTEVNALRKAFEQLKAEGKKIDFTEFDKAIQSMAKDVPKIEQFLEELKKQLASMSASTEGFQELTQYIAQTEKAISDLKDETEDTDKKGFVPLRKRLKELKIAMQELEEQGMDNTEQYQKMRMEAAKLTDDLGDQAEAIRVLASDTYAFDAVVDGLQNVTAGFQVFEGAMALAGGANEDVQKSMQKLMALMNIANGLQQIQNFLTGQSAANLAIQSVWTKSLALANGLLAKTTWGAALAARGFGTALAATGIGAIVVVVGLLVNALIDWIDVSDEAKQSTDRLNQSIEDQNYLLDLNLARIDRDNKVKIAKLKAQGATEQEIFDATTKGMEEGLMARRDKLSKVELEVRNALAEARKRNNQEEIDDLNKKQQDLVKERSDLLDLEAEIEARGLENQADNNKKAQEARKKRNDDAKKKNEELAQLEEQFQKKLQSIRNQAADVQGEQSPKSEAIIRAKYARELAVEIEENKKTFAKLGKEKVAIINKAATDLSQLQADIEVKGFKKEQEQARDELIKSIRDQQSDIANQRIALIKDENERVNAEIKQEEEDRKNTILDQYNETQTKIQEQIDAGLISPTDGAKALADAQKIMYDALDIVARNARERTLQNQKAYLQSLLDQAKTFAELQGSETDKIESARILEQAKLLEEGKIKYSDYLLSIEKIQKESNQRRTDEQIKQAQNEIDLLTQQLSLADAKDKPAIEKRINELQTAINKAKTGILAQGKDISFKDTLLAKLLGVDATTNEGKKAIQEFTSAVNEAIQSTVSLLKQQAAAEVQAADAAIEAQRKRVDEASKIAEEGNAEYLQQEEERLRELEIKREQAARKQLQIDAAIQASQILVAVAGAAAQITRGGAANVATGIASIVAAIASGAALVRSLESNRPRFFEGTDYVTRGTNPVGRDKIPAMLHEGEAVISADKNKRYGETIRAIRRGLLPEDVLNNFVRNYSNGIRYDRIGDAVSIKQDDSKFAEMNDKLARLESVMSMTAEALQSLKVNVRMDEDGFAASINTHLNKRNKMFKS